MAPAKLPRRTVLALLAVGPAVPTLAAAPPTVLASFSILADFARVLGGQSVRVSSLVGPGQDPHTYQPRPSDAAAVATAQVMIINGLGFESWAERLASAAPFRGVPVVATRGVQALRAGEEHHGHGHSHAQGHDHGGVDPHAWQDVANAKIYIGNIRDGLIKANPADAAVTMAAGATYLAELDRLDAEIRAAWAAIPRERRRIVTSHDAFTYYGDAYDVDFRAPQGISTESNPTPRQLAALISQIRTEHIRALFVESIANPQILRQVASETGARIGPAVYSDALSDATGPAASYLDMMRHNTQAFTSTLR